MSIVLQSPFDSPPSYTLGSPTGAPTLFPQHINALPTELLTQIFLLLVQEEFDLYRFDGLAYDELVSYPWTFVAVCKSWKDLCLEAPILWAYFGDNGHSCYGVSGEYRNVASLRRTRLQLERSLNALISFDATMMCSCESETTRYRMIAAHAYRWKLVVFYLCRGEPEDSPEGGFLRSLFPLESELGSLVQVDWWGFDHRDHVADLALPLDCSTLSSLHTASFSRLGNHRTEVAFPWNQLHTLILLQYRGTMIHDLFDILDKCAGNLVRFELAPCEITFYDGAEPVSGRMAIHLPRLDSLMLATDIKPGLTFLLPYIDAPILRTLQLNYIDVLPASIDILQNFLTSCHSSLINLSLFYLSDISRFFQNVPLQHLQHLCFRHTYGNTDTCNALLEMAARRDSEKGTMEILPRLEYLELVDLEFDPILLARMVESRVEAGTLPSRGNAEESSPLSTETTLRKLHISWHRDGGDEQTAQDLMSATRDILEDYVRGWKMKLECSIIRTAAGRLV